VTVSNSTDKVLAESGRDVIPKVLRYNTICILVLEGQHPASGMLDKHDLVGAQQLLRDDDAAERVDGGCASLLLSVSAA
jgi:hypothetical protein